MPENDITKTATATGPVTEKSPEPEPEKTAENQQQEEPRVDVDEKIPTEVLVIAYSLKYLHFVVGRAVFKPQPPDEDRIKPEFRKVSDVIGIEDCMYVGEQYVPVAPHLQIAQPVVAFMRVPKYLLFGKFRRNFYNMTRENNDFDDVRFLNNCPDREAAGIRRGYYTLARIFTVEAFERFEEEQAARQMMAAGKVPGVKHPLPAPGKLVGIPKS